MGTTPDGIGTNTAARKGRPHKKSPSLVREGEANANDELERRLKAQAQLRVKLAVAKRAPTANPTAVANGHTPHIRSSTDSTLSTDEERRDTREGRLREALLARNKSK